MKQLITVAFLFIGLTISAQNKKNLKLHYDFKSADSNGIILDQSKNKHNATLKNGAFVDKMDNYTILNLGVSKGYLDMGSGVGNLISSLTDFTVSTYVCISESADLNANGNFIWTFSNSDDIISQPKGCMFYSPKKDGYKITLTDYRTQQGVGREKNMVKQEWKHLVYTQSGTAGSVYVDGNLIKSSEVNLLPKALGKTIYNFIGRSPYKDDSFLKGLISDFRIYNKTLSAEEIKKLATDLDGLNKAYEEYKKKPVEYVINGNPLFSHKYTADPAALVYDDTFYIYSGLDMGDGKGYDMPKWAVFSSKDLKTWTEHYTPLQRTDFKWATENTAWASQVVERNGKFYWYVSTEHAKIPGKAIGVAVSDSPTGPFKDARGSAMVTNDMTTKWTGISWDDIDPTVLIDDDGQAYIFWGNTQCYYAKLKDNMIELDSEIMPVDVPNFTEAPWIHKRGNTYYLSYSAWWPEKTVYATSDNINGPWEYKGIINEIAGNSNTNHHAIVEFKNKWYFVYHNGGLFSGGSYLRSVCLDYLYYNEDNTIKKINMTTEGVKKVESTELEK